MTLMMTMMLLIALILILTTNVVHHHHHHHHLILCQDERPRGAERPHFLWICYRADYDANAPGTAVLIPDPGPALQMIPQ